MPLTFDWSYVVLVLLPGLLLGMWAEGKIRRAYARASTLPSRRGVTGAQVAEEILDAEGIRDVRVEPTHGFLSDHYHPLEKRLRLSEPNYAGDSLAAVGVSAHEVGHAIQHAQGYVPLMLRSFLVPVCQVGQWIGMVALMMGGLLLFTAPVLGRMVLFWGIVGYAAVFLFTLVTVPVEYNASSRALRVLSDRGLVAPDELPEVKRVLDAAALTYVAAAVQVLLVLLHLIVRYSGSDRSDD